jgi:hypothetical protein
MSKGAPHLYGAKDLEKLKDSKPIPIIAHTGECIVPVVYTGMVNKFLKEKGIQLPLTHHQLADMKREAGTPGYAKGTHSLKATSTKTHTKEDGHQVQNVTQRVIVRLDGHHGKKKVIQRRKPKKKVPGSSSGAPFTQSFSPYVPTQSMPLRPFSVLDTFRPHSTAPPVIYPQHDLGKLAIEHKNEEAKAIDRFTAELEEFRRMGHLNRLTYEMAKAIHGDEFKPEVLSPSEGPIRNSITVESIASTHPPSRMEPSHGPVVPSRPPSPVRESHPPKEKPNAEELEAFRARFKQPSPPLKKKVKLPKIPEVPATTELPVSVAAEAEAEPSFKRVPSKHFPPPEKIKPRPL